MCCTKCAEKLKQNQKFGNVSLNFTVTNNSRHPPSYLYAYISLVHFYLISILLIKWNTTGLPLGYYSAHGGSVWFIVQGLIQNVSPIQNPMLTYLIHLLKWLIHIHHDNYMYVNLIYTVRLHCTTKEHLQFYWHYFNILQTEAAIKYLLPEIIISTCSAAPPPGDCIWLFCLHLPCWTNSWCFGNRKPRTHDNSYREDQHSDTNNTFQKLKYCVTGWYMTNCRASYLFFTNSMLK